MPKPIFYLFLCLLCVQHFAKAQGWSEQQLSKANTAKDIGYLTNTEKEAVMYINLARMYPKEFLNIEVKKILPKYGDKSDYEVSLIEELTTREPVEALRFDAGMYELAKCFAKESGDKGIIGHDRITCKGGFSGECCTYGYDTGIAICLSWLVDEGVPSLGHRKICLDGGYKKIGLSYYPTHLKYGNCTVADFSY